MLRRRRPLMRAAMVGGAGYAAGRRMAQRDQEEAYQNEQLDQLQQSAPVPAPAAAAPPGEDRVEQLTKLKGLLDAGVLTEAEFQTEKARILGGG